MTPSPSEQRRLEAVIAAVQRSDVAPVPICGDLALLARGGSLPEGVASMCGEHPLSGLFCGHCHRAHDKRADLQHDTFSAERLICMVCHEVVDPLPPDGGWVEMQLTGLTLVYEFGEELFHIDKLVVPVNIADRICGRCRESRLRT